MLLKLCPVWGVLCWAALRNFASAVTSSNSEIVGAVPPQVREYCQSETFRATCPKNQVVVMKKALYGRMGTGRCLTDEFGNLGCEFDVLREMDNICSGTNSCEFKVDDSSFAAVKPFCHAQLKSYLLAGYDCVPVHLGEDSCAQKEIHVDSSSEGYISSVIAEQTSCGANDLRPWIITVSPGQLINITLFDFSSNVSDSLNEQYPPVCKVYATIRENQDSRSLATTVCGFIGRITPVYLSSSHQVQIRLMSSSSGAKPRYLLHYQAVGCATPIEADGMKVDRTADIAMVTCIDTEKSWKLTCKGNQWDGIAPSNCTKEGMALATQEHDEAYAKVPYALSITIIVAIALIVSCLIFVVGVLCIRRRIHHNSAVPRPDGISEIPDYYDVPPKMDHYPKVSHGRSGIPGHENEYATMRLLRSSCFSREPTPRQQDCCTISSTYDPCRPGMSEHTYESPEMIRRQESFMEGTTSPHYFDLMTRNGSSRQMSPQYFDIDLPMTFQLHASVQGQSEGVPTHSTNAGHSSFHPNRESTVRPGPQNKYSL